MARILMKKNQNYPKQADELATLKQQLEKEKSRFTAASAADKAKLKPALDALTVKTANLKKEVAKADAELDRAFVEYAKVVNLRPQDKNASQ